MLIITSLDDQDSRNFTCSTWQPWRSKTKECSKGCTFIVGRSVDEGWVVYDGLVGHSDGTSEGRVQLTGRLDTLQSPHLLWHRKHIGLEWWYHLFTYNTNTCCTRLICNVAAGSNLVQLLGSVQFRNERRPEGQHKMKEQRTTTTSLTKLAIA